MRLAALTLIVSFAATCAAFAAPPAKDPRTKPNADREVEKPAVDNPLAEKPLAGKPAGKDKADGTGALAERRAAAARQKAADGAKRLFPKFDANRDKVLDDAEWTKAKAAIDKMVDGEVLKSAGARRELVREALQNVTRPDVQNSGTDITPEAIEQYARDCLVAATEAADNAQPEVAPTPPPPAAGRRAGSDNGEEPRNSRAAGRTLPRGDMTDKERAKEESLRRRGLREEGGRIVPIVPSRPGANGQGNGPRPRPQPGPRPM
jgi:hypothetical protein